MKRNRKNLALQKLPATLYNNYYGTVIGEINATVLLML